MLNTKYLIAFLLLSVCFQIAPTKAICELRVSPTNSPLMTKKFGSKTIILPSFTSFIFDDEDTVEAYCSSGFANFRIYNYYGSSKVENNNLLKLRCQSDTIFLENDENSNFYLDSNLDLACRGTAYSMFESNDRLAACENDQSYALGSKLSTSLIIAGVCYELERLQLKYVGYKLHEPSNLLFVGEKFYPVGLTASSLGRQLKSAEAMFTFANQAFISDALNEAVSTNFWLRLANYELDNIVQLTTYYRETFHEFGNFLNILWWHNLRTGNWQRFVNLLQERASSVIYNIYNGASGTVMVPAQDDCKKPEPLFIKYKGMNKFAPKFVWTYIQSTDEKDLSEDFVVIGYNSPYFEYFDKNSNILCEDICDKIVWLTPLQNSRKISALGTLYCCHPEEVTSILDGFPWNASNMDNTTLSSDSPMNLGDEDEMYGNE